MSTLQNAVLIRAYGGVDVAHIAEAIERNRTVSRIGKVVADFTR